MGTIIKPNGQQAFQYVGELIPNEITVTKAAPGPSANYFKVQSGDPGWTLYYQFAQNQGNVNLLVNWPSSFGTISNDTVTEIEVSGDGLFPVKSATSPG